MKTLMIMFSILIAASVSLFSAYIAGKNGLFETKKIYVLKKPLKLPSPDPDKRHYLPPGTTLYFDKAMPEGFDRYYVYVNIFGEPLNAKPVPEKFFIAPLSAHHDEASETE